jgi:hypothetical protein
MLESNRRRVQNLSGSEIWMFIVARVLVGFSIGALTMLYFPRVAVYLMWPALFVGSLLFGLASKGLWRSRGLN